MRWKKDKTLIYDKVTYFCDKDRKIVVPEEDIYIIERLSDHTCDAKELVSLVMEKESLGELDANFRMAEFVEKYGEWIDTVYEEVFTI